MLTNEDISINRKYKDTLFRAIFGRNKENALSLYNALNNTSYEDSDELEITTLQDVIYMKHKNDVSFIIGSTLNLYEQQSTYCPNMPLRGFFYFADLIRQRIKITERLYSNRLLKIPLPRYIVFYNGTDKKLTEEVIKLRLSDSFELPDTENEFEWTATVVDITRNKNSVLKESCKLLSDYCTFVEEVRTNLLKYTDKEAAVDLAVNTCIENGILNDFLSKHRREVKNMCLTEFNEEAYKEMILREKYEDGLAEGIIQGKTEGKLEFAKSMVENGTITKEDAALALGVSVEELENMFKDLEKNN